MNIVSVLYMQQALDLVWQSLESDYLNNNEVCQTMNDDFVTSTKTLDIAGPTGAL